MQRTLAKENNLGQALFFRRSDPALRVGIQVRAHANGSTRPDAMMARNDWVNFVSRSSRKIAAVP
jgi:hypothetical protein